MAADPALIQTVIATTLPTMAVLVGILLDKSHLGDINFRLDDLRAHMEVRFDSFERDSAQRHREILRHFDLLQERLKH